MCEGQDFTIHRVTTCSHGSGEPCAACAFYDQLDSHRLRVPRKYTSRQLVSHGESSGDSSICLANRIACLDAVQLRQEPVFGTNVVARRGFALSDEAIFCFE